MGKQNDSQILRFHLPTFTMPVNIILGSGAAIGQMQKMINLSWG